MRASAKRVTSSSIRTVISTSSRVAVPLRPQGQPRQPGGIFGFRDTNGDGKADVVTEKFGEMGGTGLELRNGYLYFASPTAIGRFKLTPGELKPAGPAEIVVDGLPAGGGHAEKDITFDNAETFM